MELAKIIKYLDKKFNEKLAAPWDNVGLQQLTSKPVTKIDLNIQKVVVCLDVNLEAINFAIDSQAQLIISRHPFLFGDLDQQRREKKDLIKLLLKHHLVIYSLHTNYDASPNQNLINLLSTKFQINKSSRIGSDREGFMIKLKAPIKVSEYITNFQTIFPNGIYQTTTGFDSDTKIKSFCIVPGAGGQAMIDERLADEHFVTGEMKWHELIYANDNHVSTLMLGHYMENYFVSNIVQLLSQSFPELDIQGFDIQNQIINL